MQGLFRCRNYIYKQHYVVVRQEQDTPQPPSTKYNSFIPDDVVCVPDYALLYNAALNRTKKNINEGNAYIRNTLETLGFAVVEPPVHRPHKHPPDSNVSPDLPVKN